MPVQYAMFQISKHRFCYDPRTGSQVTTLDRSTLELSVLGYSVLPVFCRAADGSQPTDKGDARVCINAGGFQLPLWPTYPPSSGALRAAALQARPRLPCTSVTLRIMTPAEARPQRYAAVKQICSCVSAVSYSCACSWVWSPGGEWKQQDALRVLRLLQ